MMRVAYYVFDDGSTLLAILSQYYPETPSMAEQQPTHLPRRPDYLRFTVDAIAKPKEVLIYVCGVMDLCFNNYVNSREILLGLTSMENQSPVRVWLEQMFQDQDENLSTASDLFEDIESSVKGLFETSCSLYWVPTRSFDNVVYKSSTSDSAIPSVQLIESLPPHLGMNLYNIAHQSTIEEAPAPEKDSETPKTRPTETSNALHVLIWHMLIVEPNSDAAVRLGDIQMAAGALRSYSIALDSVLKLVPQENLYPSTVLCEYCLEFNEVKKADPMLTFTDRGPHNIRLRRKCSLIPHQTSSVEPADHSLNSLFKSNAVLANFVPSSQPLWSLLVMSWEPYIGG